MTKSSDGHPLDVGRPRLSPLAIARTQIGVAEDPPGSNRGIPFTRYAFEGEEPLPWCARFVRWCFIEAGTPLPGNRWLIGRVEALWYELDARGAILRHQDPLAPGDLIFYRDRGQSDQHVGGRHIGIIDAVGTMTLATIEGNLGHAVKRRDAVNRHGPDVWGFARWPIEVRG